MFIHYRTKGIFIKRQEREEADILFTVYTQNFGKIDILGKSIRKINSKLRAGSRELCLSEIEFIQGKTHKTLTDSLLIDNFPEIREDLDKTEIAFQICNILDQLVAEEQKDDQIWELLLESFERLNTEHKLCYFFFLWNLLAILGYQPELYKCALCEKKLDPNDLHFSSEQGGLVCSVCAGKDSISVKAEVIKILRLILNKNWDILTKLKTEEKNWQELEKVSQKYVFELK